MMLFSVCTIFKIKLTHILNKYVNQTFVLLYNIDSLTSRSLSDETDNGLAAENISIASELQVSK